MFRISQKYLLIKSNSNDCIIIFTKQPHRSIVLTKCRYKTANLNSRNYYDLLGVERTATSKDIKKAFFKLSKEYHPDSNSDDKSLHDKFVKINEAFTILGKQSTRNMYDQSLSSISRPSSTDWSNINYGSRSTYERRSNTNESNWNTGYTDKAYYDMFRRRMEYDKQRSYTSSYYYSPKHNVQHGYFGPASIILIIIGLGLFLHGIQMRVMRFSDTQYAIDPRARHYHAYREWRRLTALKNIESNSITQESSLTSSSSTPNDEE